jgi:hypothetical protein
VQIGLPSVRAAVLAESFMAAAAAAAEGEAERQALPRRQEQQRELGGVARYDLLPCEVLRRSGSFC